MAILTLKDLSIGYGSHAIVENINLEIKSGEFVCVIGENGSGKTTLMKTLLGLIPPISGKIIRGDKLTTHDIGYMPQISSAQRDFPASVNEIVLSGFIGKTGIFPFYNKMHRAVADEAMRRLGILNLKNRCYRELSGGQQQRVLLARALCATNKLILLDEPASGLDTQAAEEMYRTVQTVNRDGVTVIMILHDTDTALRCASSIIHVGHEVFFGSPDEYLKTREADKE